MTTDALDARALLFDFDGVLIDSAAAVELAWGRWAGEHGLDPGAVLGQVHGVRTVETVARLTPHLDAAREAARIEEREVDHTDRVTAYPGAAELLAGLPAGTWAIVTSGSRRLATARLAATGLPVPEVFVTADDVRTGKPAPDPYLLAARQLGLPPAACVVVEDSPAGVAAAHAAGMRVVALRTTHAPAQFDAPTALVDDISGLTVTSDDDGGLRLRVV